MSDLCHNCGDCHLIALEPCHKPLQYCDICNNYGHQYLFCPLSIRTKCPEFKGYWALCHNCDAWHLPEPCTKRMVLCLGCKHQGHLQVYCPVAPLPRSDPSLTTSTGMDQLGPKSKKRRGADGSDINDDLTSQMSPEKFREIRMETTQQVLDMLKRGHSHIHVMSVMAGQFTVPSQPAPTAGKPGMITMTPHTPMSLASDGYASDYGNPYQQSLPTLQAANLQQNAVQMAPMHFQGHKQNQLVHQATPVSNVYGEMQERFDKRELAKPQESDNNGNDMVQYSAPDTAQALNAQHQYAAHVPQIGSSQLHTTMTAPMTLLTQPMAPSNATPMLETREMTDSDMAMAQQPQSEVSQTEGRTGRSGTRCAECVQKHKKCVHMGDSSATPSASAQEEGAVERSSTNMRSVGLAQGLSGQNAYPNQAASAESYANLQISSYNNGPTPSTQDAATETSAAVDEFITYDTPEKQVPTSQPGVAQAITTQKKEPKKRAPRKKK